MTQKSWVIFIEAVTWISSLPAVDMPTFPTFFNLQLLIKMDADYSIYKVYDYSTITVMTQFSTTL